MNEDERIPILLVKFQRALAQACLGAFFAPGEAEQSGCGDVLFLLLSQASSPDHSTSQRKSE